MNIFGDLFPLSRKGDTFFPSITHCLIFSHFNAFDSLQEYIGDIYHVDTSHSRYKIYLLVINIFISNKFQREFIYNSVVLAF